MSQDQIHTRAFAPETQLVASADEVTKTVDVWVDTNPNMYGFVCSAMANCVPSAYSKLLLNMQANLKAYSLSTEEKYHFFSKSGQGTLSESYDIGTESYYQDVSAGYEDNNRLISLLEAQTGETPALFFTDFETYNTKQFQNDLKTVAQKLFQQGKSLRLDAFLSAFSGKITNYAASNDNVYYGVYGNHNKDAYQTEIEGLPYYHNLPRPFYVLTVGTEADCETLGQLLVNAYNSFYSNLPSIGCGGKHDIDDYQAHDAFTYDVKYPTQSALLIKDQNAGCSVGTIDSAIQPDNSGNESVYGYSATRVYENSSIQMLDAEKLPCIALWPDILDTVQPGEPAWKLYYLFVCFRYDADSLHFSTQAFDIDGNEVSKDNQILGVNTKEGLTQWWRNYFINAKPGFIQFFHNHQSIGVMLLHDNPLQNTYRLHRTQQHMKLAFDFGTTCSIAAVRIGNQDCTLPALDDNHLLWLLNKKEGNLPASRYFISGALCKPSAIEQNGAILTAIRRFDSAIQQSGRKTDSVHIDGNIHFMAENFKRDEQDIEIRSGFKIMLHHDNAVSQEDAEQMTFDTRLFIKQMLHMYFLYCCKQDANRVDVCFATPLALSSDEKKKLVNVFTETTREVAENVGFVYEKDVNIFITSESKAVGAYFQNDRTIMNLNGRGIFTLDIGGGTSDYSFWLQDHGQITSFVCCSNRMAGHEMLARFLYNELLAGVSIEYLFTVLEEQAAAKSSVDNYLLSLISSLKQITVSTERAAGKIEWITDQLLILHNDVFTAAILDPRCSKLLSVITFQMALLLWVGQVVYSMVKERLSIEYLKRDVTLCLAGNGSNFYRLLPENRKNAINSVFNSMGMKMDIQLPTTTRDQKTEVAKGMLMDDRIYEADEDDEDMPQRVHQVDIIWDGLIDFLKRYAENFNRSFSDEIAAVILRLLKQPNRVQDIQEDFKLSVHSLSDLNHYIVRLKDKILHDATTPVQADP
ncbi:MAG TPA: hypothetical protein PKJ47_08145 [Candidatus Limiplasma sp.]|nr:hypothetical protein [Candidatus Limiplasma sp.]